MAPSEFVYYLLNKPVGYLSAMSDSRGRKTIADLVPEQVRLFPVGRLDLDSEGLMLITNDGELAHALTHPSHEIEKEYVVTVEGKPSADAIRQLEQGVQLEDGMTAPASARLDSPNIVHLVIHEGRNRQVRRMCAAVGHPVIRLQRVRIANLIVNGLRPGEWRVLESPEIDHLYELCGLSK